MTIREFKELLKMLEGRIPDDAPVFLCVAGLTIPLVGVAGIEIKGQLALGLVDPIDRLRAHALSALGDKNAAAIFSMMLDDEGKPTFERLDKPADKNTN